MNTSRILRARLLLGLSALLCFTPGCRDKDTALPAAIQSEGRLTAALAISDLNKRDAALRAAADVAAQAGDALTVRKAVLQMADLVKRDDAASSSALALAKGGKRAEAADIARMMADMNKRDDTLSKLAEK